MRRVGRVRFVRLLVWRVAQLGTFVIVGGLVLGGGQALAGTPAITGAPRRSTSATLTQVNAGE